MISPYRKNAVSFTFQPACKTYLSYELLLLERSIYSAVIFNERCNINTCLPHLLEDLELACQHIGHLFRHLVVTIVRVYKQAHLDFPAFLSGLQSGHQAHFDIDLSATLR